MAWNISFDAGVLKRLESQEAREEEGITSQEAREEEGITSQEPNEEEDIASSDVQSLVAPWKCAPGYFI